MTKSKSKKLAALALSMCLATGAVAAIGYTSNKGLDVFAKTAHYQVSEATMGYGEENKATDVTVTAEEPATLTLEGVAAGQYYLNVIVNEVEGEDYPSLTAQIGEEGQIVYLNYNFYMGRYTALVKIDADTKTITLSTGTTNTYTLDAYLSGLFIGPENDYIVSDVEISADAPVTLALEYVEAGNYFLALNLQWFVEVPEDVVFTAKLNDGEEITLQKSDMLWNGYAANIEITEESTSLTISTTSKEALTGDISIEKLTTVSALPEEATLSIYQPETYTYISDFSGYYSFNVTNVDVDDATFGISIRTELDGFGGTNIEGNNFPIYLEEGTEYFIEVTYMGTEDYMNSPSQATVKFSVDQWEVPTLKAYSEMVYAPVTSAQNVQAIKLDVKNDTYTLSLIGMPYFAYMANAVVIAHFGYDQLVMLTPSTGYSTEVTLNGATELWLTTDFGEDLVVGVALGGDAQVLELDKVKDITLSGTNQTALFVMTLELGNYNITLDTEYPIQVSVDGIVAIKYGAADGEFTVSIIEDEETNTATVVLLFEYEGEEEITFSVLVEKV